MSTTAVHFVGTSAALGGSGSSGSAVAAPPVWLQILSHLEQQEQRACERLDLVVQLYHEPLRDRSKGYLTFAQHWSMFSNLSTLFESQRALLLRFSSAISALKVKYEMRLAEGSANIGHPTTSLEPGGSFVVAHAQVNSFGSNTGPPLALPPLPPTIIRRTSSIDMSQAAGVGPAVQQQDSLVHEPSTGSSTPSSGSGLQHPAASTTLAQPLFLRGPPAPPLPPSANLTTVDPLELLAGVAESTFGDPCMSHFIAEHMMYTLNYGRTIFPMLTELIDAVISTSSSSTSDSSAAAAPATPLQRELTAKTFSKLLSFLKSASLAATSHGLHKSYLPEVDPMAVKGPMWTDAAPVEELLLYLATPLSSLQRYVLAARCLIECHCFSGASEGVLVQFVQTAALRGAEEGSLLLDQCSSHEVSALIARMEGFTAPQAESRTLIHYGRLLKKFRRGRHVRLMFVFSDVLCYVEELSNGRLRVRGLLPVDSSPPLSIRDVDDVPEQNILNCFEITAGGVLYVFFAESQPQKAHWMVTLQYAVNAAQRRKHPNMVAKATSGDIITTVRSTWATTQQNSRLGRQRRDDTKMQMQAIKQQQQQHQRVISRVSSTGGVAPYAATPPSLTTFAALTSVGSARPPVGAVIGNLAVSAAGNETPTDKESRRKAIARQSLRASFDVSHWNQMSTAHQRVRSQDVIGQLMRTASGGPAELLSPDSLSVSSFAPAAAAGNGVGGGADEQQQELFPPLPLVMPAHEQSMLLHLSMPPPVSPLTRAAAATTSPAMGSSFGGSQPPPFLVVRHVDPQDDHGEDRAAEKASLLES